MKTKERGGKLTYVDIKLVVQYGDIGGEEYMKHKIICDELTVNTIVCVEPGA